MATATATTLARSPTATAEVSDGWFVRAGMAMSDWCERWFPDAFVLKIRARDMVGYALLYFFVNSILVLFLVWFFARSIAYVPPVL